MKIAYIMDSIASDTHALFPITEHDEHHHSLDPMLVVSSKCGRVTT
jgi:hypothetical protein